MKDRTTLTELDEMVSSAIEAAIETSPEFSHGWRSMPDKELIPEILDEIPIEYTEKDVAEAIYRYKVRRLTGTTSPITAAWQALSPDIRSRAEEIAGDNRPVTWPEVLLLVGTAIAGERERCAGAVSDVSLEWFEDGGLDLQKALGEVLNEIIRGDS